MPAVTNPNEPVQLSIIITGWNIQRLVRQVMDSTRRISESISYEVIYVDNRSDDDTLKLFEAYPETIVIVNPRDLGFAGANNRGMERSRGKYVLLLNSDAEIAEGSMEKCIAYMDAHPETGILGAHLLNTDGSFQGGYSNFPTFRTFFRGLTGSIHDDYVKWKAAYSPEPKVRDVDWVSGAFLFIRRNVIEQIGLLDERFFFYVEEVDFCYRATLAGWKVQFLSDVQIYHHHRQTTGKGEKNVSLMSAHALRSQQIYAWTYFGALQGVQLMMLSLGVSTAMIGKGLIEMLKDAKLGRKYIRNGLYGFRYAWEAITARQQRIPRLPAANTGR